MANNWMGVVPSPGNPQDMHKPRTYGGTKTPGGQDMKSFVSGSGFGKTLGGSVAGFGGAVAGAGLDLLGSYIGSEISGIVNEKYAKRAEERMDKRNRQMLLDQPSLTAEGRRRAGLNPYGDAVLPGMTSQSTPDTSPGSVGQSAETFSKYARLSFDEQVAFARLENERLVAESQANKNNAEADAVRGQESRNVEGWSHQLELLIGSVQNQELKNSLLSFDKELREYTIENEKALSDAELEYAVGRLDEQVANILLTNASEDEKRASIEFINEQKLYLSLQREVYAKTGLDLAYADVERAWAYIENLDKDTALKSAQTDVERAAIGEVYARIDKINAEVKEIPKNSRAARFGQYTDAIVGSITGLSEQALNWFGAVATGGVSAGVRSVGGRGGYNRPATVTVHKPTSRVNPNR